METPFTNSIVIPEDLPVIESAIFSPIDRRYLKILYTHILIRAVLFSSILLVLPIILVNDIPGFVYGIILAMIVAITVYSLIITKLSFPKRGYLIRERDIAYQRGLIKYRLTTIPFNRVQHVELIQTILAKRVGLAQIKIFTAGSNTDDLVIPGLPLEIASNIREFLTEKISRDAND